MTKKIIIILTVLISITSLIFIFIVSKKPTLSLTIEPQGSTVLIDGAEIKNKALKIKVDQGIHEIQVVKEGYRPYQQEITIKEDYSQKIVLIPIDQEIVKEEPKILKISPYFAEDFRPISDKALIAINKNNSYLVKITDSGVTTLYSKPVYTYSYVYPFVALIEKGGQDKIVIINIENNQTKIYDARTISPIISIALETGAKKMFLLGKQDLSTRTSVLYTSPIEAFNPNEIGSFVADSLHSLPENKIVFSLSADAMDLSKFSVYDLSNSKYLYQTKGNGVLISPSFYNLVFYSSDNIILFNLDTTETKNHPFSFANQKVFWKDDNTLGILSNKYPGVSISLINFVSGYQTSNIDIPQLNQISIRFILGSYNNVLYLLDAEGKTWSVNLP